MGVSDGCMAFQVRIIRLCLSKISWPLSIVDRPTECCLQVVGHIKTVIILMGGCLFFGDEMPLKKLAGISVAMVGIVWYSQVMPTLELASSSKKACTQIESGQALSVLQ